MHTPTWGNSADTPWDDLLPGGVIERLANHRFLKILESCLCEREMVRVFLVQHHHYSSYFTRNLCALMSNLPAAADVKAVAENLREELGAGTAAKLTHAELYLQSMTAFDATPGDMAPFETTRNLMDTMALHCRSPDPVVGLAALCLGAEAIVPIIYQPVLSAMNRLGAPESGKMFFEIHVAEDEDHAIVMQKILTRLIEDSPLAKQRAIAIGSEMVNRRIEFLDGIWNNLPLAPQQ